MQTLVDHLARGAELCPDELAFEFLMDGGGTERISRGGLWKRVTLASAEIRQYASAGDRVLVSHPPGIDFIVGLLGCLHAGAIAVPVPPLTLNSKLDRLESIVADADPAAAIGRNGTAALTVNAARISDRLRRLRWMSAVGTDEAAPGDRHSIDPRGLALLQYTSGSTAEPKGVMITHANLISNIQAIGSLFEPCEGDRAAFWLPPYHDMGLVGGILASLVHRVGTTLLSPASFLRRPLRWLDTISRTGAKVSGAPNFAYALCARRLREADLEQIDLSCWKVAFCGAEPVHADVMRDFAEVFSRCGFRARSLYPCYGLAEATLLVTGGTNGAGFQSRSVDCAVLANERRAVAPRDEARQREVVSCGRACPAHEVRVVDATTREPLAERDVGEIWIRGASVAQGYWGKPDETRDTFQARLAGENEGHVYLRTGDLGFLDDGELFVTGRTKDLIVLAGRNLYPEDLECVARRSHRLLTEGRSAAFEAERGVVLVHEVQRGSTEMDMAEARLAVSRALFETYGLSPHAVVFVRPNSIPATTSGKTRRIECCKRYREGMLPELGGLGGTAHE